MCEGRVFIQSRMRRGKRLPYFAHFKGGDPNCPWHRGMTMKPDDVRAAQYQGRQESVAHRLLCEQLDLLARDDPRYLQSRVATYLPPTQTSFKLNPCFSLKRTTAKRLKTLRLSSRSLPNRELETAPVSHRKRPHRNATKAIERRRTAVKSTKVIDSPPLITAWLLFEALTHISGNRPRLISD